MEKNLDFIITILSILVVELPILFIIGKFILKGEYGTDSIIYSGTIATAMSVPYIWYVCPLFFNTSLAYYLYISQFIGILIEAIVFNNALRMSFNRALIISVIINIASFLFANQVKIFILGKNIF
jgi:hypothetical protein